MKIKALLHGLVPNTYTKKDGTKVDETIGIVADASEGTKLLQFMEIKGEALKDWKPGTCREVDILEMQQLFSGRLWLKNLIVGK